MEKREEAFRIFQCLRGPTEVSPGCQGCWVLEDPTTEGAVVYHARWDSRSLLDEHLRSDRFRQLLPYIDMAVAPPEFEVSSLIPMGGIGYLAGVIGSESQIDVYPRLQNVQR